MLLYHKEEKSKVNVGKVQQTWAYYLLHLYNHIMRLQWHSFDFNFRHHQQTPDRRHAELCVSTSVSGR